MIGSLLDDLKFKLDSTLRSAVIGAIIAGALAAAFICGAVALFLWTAQTYGVLEAWVLTAGLFLAVALIAAIALSVSRRRHLRRVVASNARAAETGGTASRFLQDPAILLTGLQILRVVGFRRLLPLLLVGGVAAGFLLTRNGQEQLPDDYPAPAE